MIRTYWLARGSSQPQVCKVVDWDESIITYQIIGGLGTGLKLTKSWSEFSSLWTNHTGTGVFYGATVCANCKTVKSINTDPRGVQGVSHGLCKPCAAEAGDLEKLDGEWQQILKEDRAAEARDMHHESMRDLQRDDAIREE